MTIWLVRHAKAGSRSSWSSNDTDRPLDPLAAAVGLTVEDAPALLEGSDVREAKALLDSVAGTNAVLCSHGDVIPDLVNRLIAEGMDANGRDAKKGSTWVLTHDGRRFVRGRYVPAP